MENNNLITWGKLVDKHLLGTTTLGKVFIRLDKENKVTGLYTMFDGAEKFVPNNENQENLESAKFLMLNIVKNKIEQKLSLKKKLKL